MKYRKPRRRQVQSTDILFTGGLNQLVTTLELGKGELIQCLNYMEVDGAMHGYVSLLGYEAFDGKGSPSDVSALLLETIGLDDATRLLIEAGEVEDVSKSSHTIGNFGVTLDATNNKFPDYSFRTNNAYAQVHSLDAGQFSSAFTSAFSRSPTGVNSHLNLVDDWTLDFQLRAYELGDYVVFEKPGCYKLTYSSSGLLTFWSSTDGISYDQSIAMVKDNLNISQFAHVSISCADLEVRMAINGEPITIPIGDIIVENWSPIYTSVTDLYIGDSFPPTNPFNGWWDEFRICDTVRWINAFDAPTGRYTELGFTEINWDDRDREAQRALITEVPGATGASILGLHIYEGELYALRNKDGVNAALWKANVTGDDGTAGWVLIDDTFNIDGKLDAINWRFSGSFAGQQVMIMCDGKSVPKVWDGTTMVDLDEDAGPYNLPDNQPAPRYAQKVSIFDNRILLAYEEDDIIMSSKDDAEDFGEGFGQQLIIGDAITNLRELPGENMAIICRNSVKILEKLEIPTSTTATPDYTFKVRNHSRQAGGIDTTCERLLSRVLYADDRGIIDFAATDKYGNFEASAISKKVNPIYLGKKSKISSSMVDKVYNQYRLYFNDGTGLYFTFHEDELKGATFVNLGIPVIHTAEGEDPSGDYWKFFSSTGDGFVYQNDKGTSFNSGEIYTEMFTSFYHYNSPRKWKQFMRMMFEISASRGTEFGMRNVFDYNSSDFPDTAWFDSVMKGIGTSWGEGNWGEFVWGGAVIQRITQYIRGQGTNMSVEVLTRSKYNDQHTIHNMIVDYQVENIQE